MSEISDYKRIVSGPLEKSLRETIDAQYAEIERLRGALKAIEGGSFPGASNLVIAGDWKAAYGALQAIARDTLNDHPLLQMGEDLRPTTE